MKALNCKFGILILSVLIGATTLQAQELKKTLKKEFTTNSSTVLELENKFSEVTIETWNKNQAVFDITIVAEHKDEAKAKKMLDKMNVRLEKNGNTIEVETEINGKIGNDNDKGDKKINQKFNFIIHAKIPADIELVLESSFSGVNITDLTGKVDISNNFGSLGLNSVKNANLELNYGEIKVLEAGNLDVDLNYGNLDITKCKDLNIDVNFGDASVGLAENVVADINMGNLTLGMDKTAGFTFSGEMNMGSFDLPKLDNMSKEKNKMKVEIDGTQGQRKYQVSVDGHMGNFELKLK